MSSNLSSTLTLSQMTSTSTSTTSTSIAGKDISDDTRVQKNGVTSTGPSIELPENSRIVHPSYLEKFTSKKDLIRRLSNLIQVLRHDESIEADNTAEWPGLAGVAQYIVSNLLNHQDKDVRLHAVLACMEIFTIYAPDVPWDREELINIFQQTVRQLGNLSHTTDPTKQPNFRHYARILELFAHVKIGCVIVDLAQQESDQSMIEREGNEKERGTIRIDGSEGSHTPTFQRTGHQRRYTMSASATQDEATPLEVVIDLIHTLLHCVRSDHPAEILELVQLAITACLDEYNPDHGAPIPVGILDELLLCIGQGPTVLAINSAAHQNAGPSSPTSQFQISKPNARMGKIVNNKKLKGTSPLQDSKQRQLPLHVEQVNPIFVTAANVIKQMLNKLATPIAQLLNGLLNGDAFVLEQSGILCPSSNIDAAPEDPVLSENSGDVYSIVYELHRVAPQILTTVIGTISNGLRSPDTAKRASVTNLLGKLFSAIPCKSGDTAIPSTNVIANQVSSSTMASEFRACYREWLGRSIDAESSIRLSVVKYCCAIMRLSNTIDAVIVKEASDTVTKSLTTDPNLEVRMEAIHQITDWVYRQQSTLSGISPALLRAVGSRCSSKQKQERRDAITGLAKIYSHRFMHVQLRSVISGGDDCPLSTIQEVLNRTCFLNTGNGNTTNQNKRRKASTTLKKPVVVVENNSINTTDEDLERFSWIPSKVFECLCYTDQVDPEMRSRVFQIIDEVLLGNMSSSSTLDESTNKPLKMTPTARAVGLSMIYESLNQNSGKPEKYHLLLTSDHLQKNNGTTNAFKFLHQFLTQRSRLQQAISSYIDARAAIREHQPGTEEALATESKAMEFLENAASISAPVSFGTSTDSLEDVLTCFHGARDKHIFRILATITDPTHSMQARARALDELPKRTKSLGNSVSEWIRLLVKRCAMSEFINAEIINHCVLLASELFKENDVQGTAVLLSCIKLVVDIFPSLGANEQTFITLTELFSDCRLESSATVKAELEAFGVVTALSSILSVASTAKPTIIGTIPSNKSSAELKQHLMKLATRDGTPEQARSAVFTLSRLLVNGAATDDAKLKSSQSSGDDTTKKEILDAFKPLLSSLTGPSRLKIDSHASKSTNIIRTLCALSALSECNPGLAATSMKVNEAFMFALEVVLIGKDVASTEDDADSLSMSDDNSSDNELTTKQPSETPSSRRKRSSDSPHSIHQFTSSNLSPEMTKSLFDNETLSFPCRRVCAAIDFLVSHTRSTILESARQSAQKPGHAIDEAAVPNESKIRSFFQLLLNILRDKGLPPSTRDRSQCKARHERAALRQCAAVNLLRLSDSRLGLEKKYISVAGWHILSETFLDEEVVVRRAVMNELSALLTGAGVYGLEGSKLPPKAPSLRFLSLICLCSDGDHGSDHDIANGNAANVGKVVTSTKNAALQCTISLRKVAEASYARCRALGKDSEKKFETQIKMMLMPEYAVPFSFHLLSHRRETPSAGGEATVVSSSQEETPPEGISMTVSDESQQRILRKRLRLLFEPLVQSLGEGADNISFLLRMTEILGKYYQPVDVSGNMTLVLSPPSKKLSIDFTDTVGLFQGQESNKSLGVRLNLLEARLKTICAASREVLLSFVKKDINLSIYPGTIQLPSSLFTRTYRGSVNLRPNVEGNASRDVNDQSMNQNNTPENKVNKKDRIRVERSRARSSSVVNVDLKLSSARTGTSNDMKESKNDSFESMSGFAETISTTSDEHNKLLEPFDDSAQKSHVQFSPAVILRKRVNPTRRASSQSKKGGSFGSISPIAKINSPALSGSREHMDSEVKSPSPESTGTNLPSPSLVDSVSSTPRSFNEQKNKDTHFPPKVVEVEVDSTDDGPLQGTRVNNHTEHSIHTLGPVTRTRRESNSLHTDKQEKPIRKSLNITKPSKEVSKQPVRKVTSIKVKSNLQNEANAKVSETPPKNVKSIRSSVSKESEASVDLSSGASKSFVVTAEKTTNNVHKPSSTRHVSKKSTKAKNGIMPIFRSSPRNKRLTRSSPAKAK